MSVIATHNNKETITSQYVKEGLVFWIDAVWNVGVGKHEDNVIPYDLTQRGKYESGSCEFGKDFIQIKMGQDPLVYSCNDVMRMFPTNDSGTGTLEVVFEATNNSYNQQYYGDVQLGEGFAYFTTQAQYIQAHKQSSAIESKTKYMHSTARSPYVVANARMSVANYKLFAFGSVYWQLCREWENATTDIDRNYVLSRIRDVIEAEAKARSRSLKRKDE